MVQRLYFGGFTRPPKREEVLKYMRGECAYIAIAFHQLHGFQVCSIAGAHLAARDNEGFYWDIRGRMTEVQITEGVVAPGALSTIEPETVEGAKRLMETGLFSDGPFVSSRLTKARKLVAFVAPVLPESKPEVADSIPSTGEAAATLSGRPSTSRT